jgi:hypothetical protein
VQVADRWHLLKNLGDAVRRGPAGEPPGRAQTDNVPADMAPAAKLSLAGPVVLPFRKGGIGKRDVQMVTR